jgi:hypothetical protein
MPPGISIPAFDILVWYRSFRYRTGSPYFRTRLALLSAFFLFLASVSGLPGCQTARQSGMYLGGTTYTLPVHTACGEKTPWRQYAGCGKTPYTSILLVVEDTPHARLYCWRWIDTVSWMMLASVNYKTWHRAEDHRIKIFCIMDVTGSNKICK